MSGIVGTYHLEEGSTTQRQVEGMMAALSHRGPDGAEAWCGKQVGLGHLMLHSTPESLHEKQPLVDSTGRIVVAADARLDNRSELLDRLEVGPPPDSVPDSALILAAYKKWGEACPDKLLGAFAFVIWDAREKKLFGARDHFGVKPFYYYHNPRRLFAFASEPKALLALDEVPRRLNKKMLAVYLSGEFPNTDELRTITSYEDILRLPPAHAFSITRNGLQRRRYWSLSVPQGLKLNSNEEYARAFKEVFTEAVRCRLRSIRPIGAHLSGGLDSSSIACTARDVLTSEHRLPLHTFSLTFDAVPVCEEREFYGKVLEQPGFEPHYVRADQTGPLSDLSHVLEHEDEIYTGPSHYLPWLLNEAVHESGLRVVLDGFDGDTTVSHGFKRLNELAAAGRWEQFVAEIEMFADRRNYSRPHLFDDIGRNSLSRLAAEGRWRQFVMGVNWVGKRLGVSRKGLLVEDGLKSLLPGWGQQEAKKTDSLLNPDFARRIGWEKPEQNQPTTTVREEQRQALTSSIMALTLESYDRSAARFSLEARHPFMDKRLIEFCLALPASQKLRNGWPRYVLRRAMKGVVPDGVRWRPGKTPPSANTIEGLLVRDRDTFDSLAEDVLEKRGDYVDEEAFSRAHNRLVSRDQPTGTDVMPVWRALMVTAGLTRNRFEKKTLSRDSMTSNPNINRIAV